MLYGIPRAEVEPIWEVVGPLLQRAIEKSTGDFSLEDVRKALDERDMQLWIWAVDRVIYSAAVTQILTFPQRKVCAVPFVGGTRLADWLDCNELIGDWARDQGCAQMEGYVRDGWLRKLKNWFKVWTTVRRDL